MMRRDISMLATLALVFTTAMGCGGNEDVGAQLDQVSDFVQGVGTSDGLGVASLRTGTAPGPSGGPGISESTESATVITGGSLSVPVSSSEGEFSAVIVAVEGASDYYEVSFSSAVTSTELVLTIGQDVPTESFRAAFALIDAEGQVGTYVTTSLAVQSVGSESPDVQVTLSWDVDSDLDLWLTDPNGETINFANTSTSTGGSLDLDSNRGCTIDGVRNESISYPSGQAPNGSYLAQVLLSGDCGTESTKYILTILVAGQSPETHVGAISGEFNPADHTYSFTFGSEVEEDCSGIPTLSGELVGAACFSDTDCPDGICFGAEMSSEIPGTCRQLCDPSRCTSVCGAGSCLVAASGTGGADGGTDTTPVPPRQVEAAGVCEVPDVPVERETNCANDIDDDDDGAADCLDSDCADDPACVPVGEGETNCANEIDDDDDGATDCLDSDCADDPACESVTLTCDSIQTTDNEGADCTSDASICGNGACVSTNGETATCFDSCLLSGDTDLPACLQNCTEEETCVGLIDSSTEQPQTVPDGRQLGACINLSGDLAEYEECGTEACQSGLSCVPDPRDTSPTAGTCLQQCTNPGGACPSFDGTNVEGTPTSFEQICGLQLTDPSGGTTNACIITCGTDSDCPMDLVCAPLSGDVSFCVQPTFSG